MAIITFDAKKINNNVIPYLTNTKNLLKTAYLNSKNLNGVLPSDFLYKRYVSNLPSQIEDMRKSIVSYNNKMNETIKAAEKIEKVNSSKASGILALASKLSVDTFKNSNSKTTGAVISKSTKVNNNVKINEDKTNATFKEKFTSKVAKISTSISALNSKISSSFKTAVDKVKKVVSDTSKSIKDFFSKSNEWTSAVLNKTGAVISKGKVYVSKAVSYLTNGENWKKIGASVANVALSAVKVLVSLFGNTLLILGSAVSTIGTGIVDIYNGIKTGNWDWTNTKAIWKNCKSIVSCNWIDKLDKKIGLTQLLDKYAYSAFKSDGVACKISSSVLNVALSAVKGLVSLVEAIGDMLLMLGSAVSTIGTGIVDIYNGIKTGNWNWTNTKAIWDTCKTMVSYNWTDKLDEKLGLRQSLDNYAYSAFKSDGVACKISEGVGYMAGIIALTAVTCGAGTTVLSLGEGALTIGSNALVAGGISAFAGVGKNTSDAWNDGAGITSGLGYGVTKGLYEGLEMTLGYAINGLKIFSGSGASSQVLNSMSHVVLDTVDGASGSILDPIFSMIYSPNKENMQEIMKFVNYDRDGNKINDKTWEELSWKEKYSAIFNYNGGWETVKTQALSAGFMSFLSEVPEMSAAFKATGAMKKISSGELTEDAISSISKLKGNSLKSFIEQAEQGGKLSVVANSLSNKQLIGMFKLLDENTLKNVVGNLDQSKLNFLSQNLKGKNLKLFNDFAPAPQKNVKIKNINDEIVLANYYTSKGNFYIIDLNNVDYVPDNLISKLDNPGNVKFRIHNKLCNPLEGEILSKIDFNGSSELKIRQAYIELNKRVNYDIKWYKANDQMKDYMYNNIVSFDNLDGNQVICKGWSELFHDLLLDVGFDPADVRIVGTGDFSHRWVEVDLHNGNIIIADSTAVLNHSNDLANCKIGSPTVGLYITDIKNSGNRLDGSNGLLSNLSNVEDISAFQWYYIDDFTGYSHGEYFSKLKNQADYEFQDPILSQKLFGENSRIDNANRLFSVEIPDRMDGYESYVYFNKAKYMIFGGDDSITVDLKRMDFSNAAEAVTEVRFSDIDRIMVYSKSLGKLIFENESQYYNFININNLNFSSIK